MNSTIWVEVVLEIITGESDLPAAAAAAATNFQLLFVKDSEILHCWKAYNLVCHHFMCAHRGLPGL